MWNTNSFFYKSIQTTKKKHLAIIQEQKPNVFSPSFFKPSHQKKQNKIPKNFPQRRHLPVINITRVTHLLGGPISFITGSGAHQTPPNTPPPQPNQKQNAKAQMKMQFLPRKIQGAAYRRQGLPAIRWSAHRRDHRHMQRRPSRRTPLRWWRQLGATGPSQLGGPERWQKSHRIRGIRYNYGQFMINP